MRGSWIVALVGLGIVAPPAGPAFARSKTPVSVRFTLQHAPFRNNFTDAVRGQVERQIEQRLAAVLDQRLGYLDFDAAGTHPSTLRFTLDAIDPAASHGAQETGLHVRLEGPDASAGSVYIKYRDASQAFTKIPDEPELVEEVVGLVGRTSLVEIVGKLLSHVPLSETARFLPEFPGWILPYREEEICMDIGSLLRVESQVDAAPIRLTVLLDALVSGKVDATTLPSEAASHQHLFALVKEGQSGLDRIRSTSPDKVLLKRICVVEFLPKDAACGQAAAPPAEVDFTGDGGSR